ncbi:MAG: Gfo/Idh/MocA family oxidoreductase [Caldilinea sp.]|nr:Gfo/Idh/MocA family oxidoreductase [Caldilinea sp.]MDW8439450.1 Gfo/Idh/MocA family oxidoreductase [Caldilineaceae bacterium]
MSILPLRAALIGCGSVSQRGVLPHLSLEDAKARIQLIAVVDAVAERAARSAEKWDVPAWYTDIDAMLAQSDVDLVLVITPIQQHFDHAMRAIQAGKHVYIQKSMTTTLAEADALLAARDRMNVKLAAAPGFELFPSTAKMRNVVESGALGRVAMVYTYTLGFGHEYEPIRRDEGALNAIDPTWYYRSGAGPLPDVTIYALQLATSVLGSVRRVTALGNKILPQRTWRNRTIEIEVEDNNVVLMEFHSGALAVAVGSDCVGSRMNPWGGLSLYGTQGALEVTEVHGASGYPTRFVVRRGGSWAVADGGFTEEIIHLSDCPYLTPAHLAIEEPHLYVDIMELVDAIVEDRPCRAGGEQARHVVEIIEAARRAIASGETQSLSTEVGR